VHQIIVNGTMGFIASAILSLDNGGTQSIRKLHGFLSASVVLQGVLGADNFQAFKGPSRSGFGPEMPPTHFTRTMEGAGHASFL
jgi:hypothetical protein